jgi:hypothetical protein
VEGEERAIVENLTSRRKDKENTEKERVTGDFATEVIVQPRLRALSLGLLPF